MTRPGQPVTQLCEAALGEVKAHGICWAAVLDGPFYDGPRTQTPLEHRRQAHAPLKRGVGLLECAHRLQLAYHTVKARAGCHTQSWVAPEAGLRAGADAGCEVVQVCGGAVASCAAQSLFGQQAAGHGHDRPAGWR